MTSLFHRPWHEEMTWIWERTARTVWQDARHVQPGQGFTAVSVACDLTHVIVHWLPNGLGAAISRPGP